jgi:hypothetical protein
VTWSHSGAPVRADKRLPVAILSIPRYVYSATVPILTRHTARQGELGLAAQD